VITTLPQAVSIATGALLVTLVDYRVMFLFMVVGTLCAVGYLLVTLHGRLGPVPGIASDAETQAVTDVEPMSPMVSDPTSTETS
jgi:hypothetical protein